MTNKHTDRTGETDEARDKAAERLERQHQEAKPHDRSCNHECAKCKGHQEEQLQLWIEKNPDPVSCL